MRFQPKEAGALIALSCSTLLLLALPLAPATVARAAGLNFTENGTPDAGWAAAGRAATAEDPTTVFGNPAGMARLDRPQVLLGVQPLFLRSSFDLDSSTSSGGGANPDATSVVVGGAYVHPLNEQWRLGTAVNSLLGGELDYGDSWAGRYYATQADLVTIEWNLASSYRVQEKVSLGAALRVVYAELTQEAAINNVLDGGADGKLKFEDDDTAVGVNLGVLYEARDDTRIGLRYRSEVDLDFRDNLRLRGVGPALAPLAGTRARIEMTLPQDLLLSVHHSLSSDVDVMLNVGWEDWSEFGRSDITLGSATRVGFTRDLSYEDTWHVALGGRYRVAPDWRVSLGFAYDSSPVDRSNRTVDLPLDRQIRLATGVQYDVNEDVTVGAAYTYIDLGDAEIRQAGGPLNGSLAGDYSPNEIHTFNVTLIWRFP